MDAKRRIKLEVNSSGRKIKVIGKDGSVLIRQGASDGIWRLEVNKGYIEEMSSKETALEEAYKLVDNKYSQKEFHRLCEIAKEGEEENGI